MRHNPGDAKTWQPEEGNSVGFATAAVAADSSVPEHRARPARNGTDYELGIPYEVPLVHEGNSQAAIQLF